MPLDPQRRRPLEPRVFLLCPDTQQLLLCHLEDLARAPDHPEAWSWGRVEVKGHVYPMCQYVDYLLQANPWPEGWRVIRRARERRGVPPQP